MSCRQISLLRLVLPLVSSLRNLVLRCEQSLQKSKEPKPKLRKLKGLRVTFEDQMADQLSNEVKLLEQERSRIEQNPDDHAVTGTGKEEELSDSELVSDSYSQADSSAPSEPPAKKHIVLSVKEAEELLGYLDLLNIRTVHSECASACLLRKNISDARERLREANRLLDTIPDTMSPLDRKAHMLKIGEYVEAVFASLNRLTAKMVECHGDAMCDAVSELDENVRLLLGKGGRKRPGPHEGRKLVDVLEVCFLFAFFCIAAVVVVLIWQPEIELAMRDFSNEIQNRCPDVPGGILRWLAVIVTVLITLKGVRFKFD